LHHKITRFNAVICLAARTTYSFSVVSGGN